MSASGVGSAGAVFLLLFAVAVPLLAYRGRDRLTSIRPLPPRTRVYVSVLLQLTLFLLLGVWTARREGVALWRPADAWPLWGVATAVVLVVMALATRGIRRAAVARREPRVYFAIPQGAVEVWLWVAVSLMAGVAEELVYRGVMTELLVRLTGSLGVAWGVAVLAFTVAHANQGLRSAIVIAVFALTAHVLVSLTGTLLFAIVLHAAYDVWAGLEYARLARLLGYPIEGVPDANVDNGVTISPGTSSA
jgi:membrane protease YdiL (CAAX protease family)